jgi:hypothetical protein
VLLAIVAVLALAVPAAAYETTWDGSPTGDITIYLSLDCYIQILWQDTEIHFDGTNDWWCTQLQGVGYSGPGVDGEGKMSTDPWAGDWYDAYFESGDGGYLYVKSNNALSMQVHSAGNLAASDTTCPGVCEIPTWFTVALSGPFYVQGMDIGTHNIPLDGWGTYCGDQDGAGSGYVMEYGSAYDWPNQYCFPMDPESQTWTLGPLCPYVEGNIMFKARIERNGLADAGGDYQTALNLTFTSP